MRAVLAIARKELLSYFFAPMAYIVIAAFLVLNGFLFSVILTALSQPGAAPAPPISIYLGGTLFFWIFLIIMVPVITMRLGAEEKKSGTLETLLTAPVSDWEVILGKYFGALALYVAAWIPTLLYVWITGVYGEVDMGPFVGGYLGVLLVGGFFTAIGLFTSILSKNQLVAAIISLTILVFILLVSILSFLVTDPFWTKVLGYIDLWKRMLDFSRGLVDTRPVVYLLSGTVLFLTLAKQALEARRWR